MTKATCRKKSLFGLWFQSDKSPLWWEVWGRRMSPYIFKQVQEAGREKLEEGKAKAAPWWRASYRPHLLNLTKQLLTGNKVSKYLQNVPHSPSNHHSAHAYKPFFTGQMYRMHMAAAIICWHRTLSSLAFNHGQSRFPKIFWVFCAGLGTLRHPIFWIGKWLGSLPIQHACCHHWITCPCPVNQCNKSPL